MCISETLPVEYLGGKPLCMNQYYEVLSSCRIPGLKRDSVVNHAKSSKPPKHITVVHNFQVRSILSFLVLLSVQCPHGLREETLTQSGGPGPDSLQPPTRGQEHKEVVGQVRGVQQNVFGPFWHIGSHNCLPGLVVGADDLLSGPHYSLQNFPICSRAAVFTRNEGAAGLFWWGQWCCGRGHVVCNVHPLFVLLT